MDGWLNCQNQLLHLNNTVSFNGYNLPSVIWTQASMTSIRRLLILSSVVALTGSAGAETLDAYLNMDLQDLLSVQVTSISRNNEDSFKAPAAVYVINQETIRRSGYNSVPDLLRLVPGYSTASISSADFAISARGFNGITANKLLVLINGRTLYSTTTAGTRWYVDDPILDTIERIEVIRGPGATMWGANAVNGVVNIITKDSTNTLGTTITAGGGNVDRAFVSATHGFMFSEGGAARMYARAQEHAAHELFALGGSSADSWKRGDTGFELDWESEKDRIETEGRLYQFEGSLYGPQVQVEPNILVARGADTTYDRGGHFLTKWIHEHSESSNSFAQFFVTTQNRDYSNTSIESFTTYDLDLQNTTQTSQTSEFTFGLNLRQYQTKINPTLVVTFDPIYRRSNLIAGFVQNRLELLPDLLTLTSGVKLERNDFSGWEYQPSLRLAWTPTENSTVWAAVSKAARTPSLFYEDGSLNIASIPFGKDKLLVTLKGRSEPLEAEDLYAYELGHRAKFGDSLAVDTSLFYHHFRNLLGTVIPNIPTPTTIGGRPALAIIPDFIYDFQADLYGIESTITLLPTERWTLEASYSFQKTHLPNLEIPNSAANTGKTTPDSWATLRSLLNVTSDIDFDGILRFVDSFPANFTNANVKSPSYLQLDLHLAWRPIPNTEISIAAMNLLEDSQLEFVDEFSQVGILNPRSVLGKIEYSF